jgi:hypothetical protein
MEEEDERSGSGEGGRDAEELSTKQTIKSP